MGPNQQAFKSPLALSPSAYHGCDEEGCRDEEGHEEVCHEGCSDEEGHESEEGGQRDEEGSDEEGHEEGQGERGGVRAEHRGRFQEVWLSTPWPAVVDTLQGVAKVSWRRRIACPLGPARVCVKS